jgi:hypothetical protein
MLDCFSVRRWPSCGDLAGALATLGQTSEALAILRNFRERHPEERLAADIEKAIQADAAGKHSAAQ